jgi:hypothetical protein
MSLLDDLKRQADSVLVKQRTTEENRDEKLKASHARMKSALQYWVEFFKALNIVTPDVRRNFYVDGTAQLVNLLQGDYDVNSRRLTVAHIDYIDSIELRFRCVSDEKLTVEKDSNALVKQFQEHLWLHGLKFELREIRKEGAYVERGIFTLFAEVTVRLTFAADTENSQVRLTVRNLERLGEYTYVYDEDEFGAELLEEIGKAILDQPNRLRTMGRRQAAAAASWGGPERRAVDSQ